jgi:hypothetical protein
MADIQNDIIMRLKHDGYSYCGISRELERLGVPLSEITVRRRIRERELHPYGKLRGPAHRRRVTDRVIDIIDSTCRIDQETTANDLQDIIFNETCKYTFICFT